MKRLAILILCAALSPPGLAQPAGVPDDPLSPCDHAGDPVAVGVCAIRAEAARNKERTRVLETMTRALRASERKPLRKVRTALATLAQDRTREVDTVGSGRATWMTEAAAAQRDQFMSNLEACAHGALPPTSADDTAAADHVLNQRYASVMGAASTGSFLHSIGYSNISKRDVRKAEGDWLGYRDAWLVFARLHCPAVPEATWRTRLNIERTRQLEQILEEGGVSMDAVR